MGIGTSLPALTVPPPPSAGMTSFGPYLPALTTRPAIPGTGLPITPHAATASITDPVVHSITHLQAQTEAMVAQAKAIAVQSLPALPCFTGEGSDITDDEFEKWLELFRD